MTAYPIFGNDNNKSSFLCFLASNNDEIMGFDELQNSQIVVALPNNMSIGQEWIANPQDPTNQQYKIKLVENLKKFYQLCG